MRNHEYRTQGPGIELARAYDPVAQGGTTTVVVDPKTRLPKKAWVSLSGTHTNCAGGPTPWGSWLTCEETTVGSAAGYQQEHGYVFEVPADANEAVTPVPLKALGRFVHEAVAIDPRSGIVYLTEDRDTSGLYRFLPKRRGKLGDGGKLEMLAVKHAPGYDTRTGQTTGKRLKAAWVPIADADPSTAEANPLAVYEQGAALGAATFARLEGAWYGSDTVYFHATSGGDAGLGQVWELRLGRPDQLTLIYESNEALYLDSPDNITVSPRGGLVLCEDGSDAQYLRGLTKRGEMFDFALNAIAGFEDQEFAGACYDPTARPSTPTSRPLVSPSRSGDPGTEAYSDRPSLPTVSPWGSATPIPRGDHCCPRSSHGRVAADSQRPGDELPGHRHGRHSDHHLGAARRLPVDWIEVADSPETDEDGFFLFSHLVDDASYLDPSESTGSWTSTLPPLEPGTYHAHLRTVTITADFESVAWTATKQFTVGPQTAAQPPVADPTPGSALPGFTPASLSAYEAHVSSSSTRRLRSQIALGDTLTVGLRAVSQPDESTSRYRICWTRGRTLDCLKRTVSGTAWDRVQLTIVPGLGQTHRNRTTLSLIWQTGARTIAIRRYQIVTS